MRTIINSEEYKDSGYTIDTIKYPYSDETFINVTRVSDGAIRCHSSLENDDIFSPSGKPVNYGGYDMAEDDIQIIVSEAIARA